MMRRLTHFLRPLRLPALTLLITLTGCTHGAPATEQGMPHVRNFGEVDPGKLYRAARCDDAGIDELVAQYHIRTVVNLDDKDDVCAAIRRNGLNYYQLPSNPLGQSRRQMKEFLRLMADAIGGGTGQVLPVYVHCNRGADRTGEAVAAYRIVFQQWTPDQAMAELSKYHYWAGFHEPKMFLATLKPGDLSVVNGVEAPAPAKCGR
jgi:protein tyrosine/serine phosphatase